MNCGQRISSFLLVSMRVIGNSDTPHEHFSRACRLHFPSALRQRDVNILETWVKGWCTVVAWFTTYNGTWAALGEEFQFSLVVDEPALAGGSPLPSDQGAVADQARDYLTSALASGYLNNLPSAIRYTHVTAAQILELQNDPVGGTTPQLAAASRRDLNPTIAGTSSERPLPPQCAVRVSLKGGTYPNGSPIRGGFFLPGPPGGLSGGVDGRMIASVRDSIAGFAADLVGAWNSELEGTTPVIWSRRLGSTSAITELRVGLAVDTIRSRRADVPEDYATFTF